MPEVEFLFICDYAFEGANAKPCLVGLFNNINATVLPATQPIMFIAFQLRGAPNAQHVVQIAMQAADGTDVLRTQVTVALSPDGGGFVSLGIVGVVFNTAGQYELSLRSGDQVLKTKTFSVRHVQG